MKKEEIRKTIDEIEAGIRDGSIDTRDCEEHLQELRKRLKVQLVHIKMPRDLLDALATQAKLSGNTISAEIRYRLYESLKQIKRSR